MSTHDFERLYFQRTVCGLFYIELLRKMEWVNDRLAFYMNDTEVAYLSNNKLYVTQAEILSKLIIGRFAFEPQTNGNLSLIYNG